MATKSPEAPKEIVSADKTDKTAELITSLERLRETVEKVPDEYGLGRPSKDIFYSYLKGIATGLGALTAVAIVIPLVIWFIESIHWVPLLGDFMASIADRMEQAQGR